MPALDENTIQSLFAARGIVEVENFTAPGCYSIQAESSFKVTQPKNRASVKWRNAEHVVLKDQPVDVQTILDTWRQVTSVDPDPVHIQKLYLFDHDDPTGPIYIQYDASGVPVATGALPNLLMTALPRHQSIQSPAAAGSNSQPPGVNNSVILEKLVNEFKTDLSTSGLKYEDSFLKRFVAALLAKPFVILTGLSGSGKTKLAEAFAAWLGEPFKEDVSSKGDALPENDVEEPGVSVTLPERSISGGRYLLVPVGADWTNNEHLLGYPNALEEGKYVMPDTGVLAFLLDAVKHSETPYFLILDEMNLSHVERYFADFLSAMESNKRMIRLHGGPDPLNKGKLDEVPPTLALPRNLFVIGTMNVDETTYMFSPKVLDRAQVLEFRVSETEMSLFLAAPPALKFDALEGKGAALAAEFLKVAQSDSHGVLAPSDAEAVQKALNAFFPPLAELGAEFGYRSAAEILRFTALYREAGAKTVEEAIDAGVIQKLLPKLHGSQARLGPVLKTLTGLASVKKTETDEVSGEEKEKSVPLYPLTHDKIDRMRKRLNSNGFASFAEA